MLLWLALFVFNPNFLPQYLIWALPFFLMAGYLKGFSRSEALAMTGAMVDSGKRLDLSRLSGPTVDKQLSLVAAEAVTR